MHVEASLPVVGRVRWGHAPGTHGSLPRTAVLVGNLTALLCSTWSALFVRSLTAARGAHSAGHGLITMYGHEESVAGANPTEPQPAVCAGSMLHAHTACSHAQPCWSGIQVHCCAARGLRCLLGV